MPANDFDWQREMSALVYVDEKSMSSQEHEQLVRASGLVFAEAIDQRTAVSIYRRNLRLGGEIKLANLFPLTSAYIGAAGFRRLWHLYLDAVPPDSPVFTLYAVQFPAFILAEESIDLNLRSAASAVAAVEFMSHNVTASGHRIPIGRRYFELYRELIDLPEDQSIDRREGLYRLPSLHPERIAANVVADGDALGYVQSFSQQGELVLAYVESNPDEA